MAESSAQEKTERPTLRRRTQAHDDGQVPRSQELSGAVVVMGGALALAFFGGSAIAHGVVATLRDQMSTLSHGPMTVGDASDLLRTQTVGIFTALAPFLLAVFVPALAVNAIQARGVLSFKPITPDFSRVSPASGLKRLLSGQSIFTLFKAIVKLTIIATIGWLAIGDAWPRIASLTGGDPGAVVDLIRTLAFRLVLLSGLAFLALSLLDYGVAVWRHDRQLRMTREEVVQEFRETEGNPLLKSRMKSLGLALVRRRMLHRVKEADVIIVNPTSIAVAIRYDGISPAPVVLAMGRRKLAERIVLLARAANVPVIQNIPVARALIASASVGRPIPPALYAAVAEVLAFVYRQRGRLPQALSNVKLA
ncbi:MAG TPA: EscU/YscU/HrcU family type III secretion system export apparatus switch protein [Gemmatimonadales bacterium]|jgi:flagellar biosynthetic protein FlhB|nr:EscU/YscU/HrcU family type III secretion system export apparatus switch protein [Gemmatimonadales bacterium]